MQFNEFKGEIDIPEFYASVIGKFDDNLRITNAVPIMQERSVNSQFFKSITHQTALYPISGTLSGQLIQDECYPLKVSGMLYGDLTYHNFENIENSPAWKIAPQVGDYFNLKVGEIEEEYEITQIFDRVLTNNNGINPLLGKYIFQCSAVRRTPSHEEHTNNFTNDSANDNVLNELFNEAKTADIEESKLPEYYNENNECKENIANKRSNEIAKKVYDYTDKSDYTYGGYQDYPKE